MSAATTGRRNRRAGKQRERQWALRLKEEGWEVAFVPRINGEQGYDILACKGGNIVLDEVKSGPSPWRTFGPAKRKALRGAASRAGGSPRLVWWPFDRQGPRVLWEEAWPT